MTLDRRIFHLSSKMAECLTVENYRRFHEEFEIPLQKLPHRIDGGKFEIHVNRVWDFLVGLDDIYLYVTGPDSEKMFAFKSEMIPCSFTEFDADVADEV